MNEHHGCQFCRSQQMMKNRAVWDEILWRVDGVTVMPTRGSLLAGWILVVPSEHVLSAAQLTKDRRSIVARVVDNVRLRTEIIYGYATVFEHGAAAAGSEVGCTVDHVHLHIAPLPFDLVVAAMDSAIGRELAWGRHDAWPDVWDRYNDADYIAATSADGIWAATGEVGSQFFRRIIADQIGRWNIFDWRSDPCVDEISRTIAAWTSEPPQGRLTLNQTRAVMTGSP